MGKLQIPPVKPSGLDRANMIMREYVRGAYTEYIQEEQFLSYIRQIQRNIKTYKERISENQKRGSELKVDLMRLEKELKNAFENFQSGIVGSGKAIDKDSRPTRRSTQSNKPNTR